jgi:hypothetical protein
LSLGSLIERFSILIIWNFSINKISFEYWVIDNNTFLFFLWCLLFRPIHKLGDYFIHSFIPIAKEALFTTFCFFFGLLNILMVILLIHSADKLKLNLLGQLIIFLVYLQLF